MRFQKYLMILIAAVLTLAAGFSAQAAAKVPLPTDDSWRTFAKPLGLGTREILFFQRDGGQAVIWRVDWGTGKASSLRLPELKLEKDDRFTAISNREGLWLLGKPTLLIRPDGKRNTAETDYNEPIATALDDGTIAVFGKSRGSSGGGIEQIKFNAASGTIEVTSRGLLSYDGRPNQSGESYLEPRNGHNAVKLLDGRILMFGGELTPKLASIISPNSGSSPWSAVPVASMPHPRNRSAALTLPDGRVVITGAPHLGCYEDAADVRSVDVYEPAKNRWTTLPQLPFTPCADSYGSDHPSIALTPDGSLVVGAHLEPHVMVLRSDKTSETGFSSSWLVYGQFPQARTGGVVQAISSTEVVVAGGVNNREGEFGGCCFATAGFDRISIDAHQGNATRALAYVGVGVARNGHRVLAAAGRRFGFTSTGQMRYSAYAELIDLRTGKVRQLPNMPLVTGGAKALWLDDDRVIVKGVQASNDRGFTGNENLSSYMPKSSGSLAVFNLKLDQWTDEFPIESLAGSTLLDARGDEAWLFSSNGKLQRLNLKNRQVQEVAQLALGRTDAVARLITPNTLIAVGGATPSERISEIDEKCASEPRSHCPDRYIGFGPSVPTTSFEALSFDELTNSSKTLLSQTVSNIAKTVTAAIARDGTVYLLASDQNNEVLRFVQNIRGSTRWRSMPAPSGGKLCKSDCALIIAPNPRDAAKELLFLRQGAIDMMWNDDKVAHEHVNVWLWDEIQRQWRHVLKSDGMKARAVPQPLAEEVPGRIGGKVMSMGWHLDVPILWIAP